MRTNDERVLGMTGAQFMGLSLIPVGLWILLKVRHAAEAQPEDPAEVEAIQAAVLARAGGGSTPGGAPAADATGSDEIIEQDPVEDTGPDDAPDDVAH